MPIAYLSLGSNLDPERHLRAAIEALRGRGVEFVSSGGPERDARGALTRTVMGSVSFELVHNVRAGAQD